MILIGNIDVSSEKNLQAVPSRSDRDVSGLAFERLACSRRKDLSGRRTFSKPNDNGNDTMTTTLSTPFFRQRLCAPTSTISFPAFPQQLGHPTNARVASRQQRNGSSLHIRNHRSFRGLPFNSKLIKGNMISTLFFFSHSGSSPPTNRGGYKWQHRSLSCVVKEARLSYQDATRALVG